MKVLHRKLARDLFRARGQAVAVAVVVLCGVANFISMASAHRNLLLTRDAYYAEYRLADFFISVERAPRTELFRLEALPGVREAEGRIVKDVNLDLPGIDEPRVGRIVSLPDRRRPVLNDIVLQSGRYFESGTANEAILSAAFARANGLRLGDRFQASINNRKHTLKVVGTALSPEYVYMIRSPQDFIPSPERFGILWTPQTFAESAFDLQGACNDIVGTVDDPAQMDALLERAETLLDPYGVFATVKREDQVSNRVLSDEIRGLGVSAKIMPAIFLSVAALVLLVLLNRMVRQERAQIGLLKAFGYTNAAVAWHYMRFAMVLGVAGCAGGFVAGQLLADYMVRLYVQFFNFPLLRSQVYPSVVLKSMGLTLFFALLGAASAARHAARIQPAEAMRPETPRVARRTVLERWTGLWRRLTFTGKMIARNMSRYRFRAALTVFGVAIAAGILFIGWFMMDIMGYLLAFQFTETQREDIRVMLAQEHGKSAWLEFQRMDSVRRAEPLLLYPFEARNGWRVKDIAVTGLQPEGRLLRLTDTRGRAVDVGADGLVLDERLARELGAGPGDTVELKPLMGRVRKTRAVRVAQVVRQYFGSGAYMNLDALSRLLDSSFATNAMLLCAGPEPGAARAVNKALKDVAAVASVEVKEDAYRNIQATIQQSMWFSNMLIVVFAGVIAFAIIYNSTIVSLAERQRELASLRVLGFSTGEVGRIVYHENFLLSAAGLALGVPLGLLACKGLVKVYDTELYRFPFHVGPRMFVLTVAFTAAFVCLANLAARRKVLRLDMVEALKARE